jgi:FdhE protein
VLDAAVTGTLAQLPELLHALDMPEAARGALNRVAQASPAQRDAMVRNLLDDAVPADSVAEHAFVAAALQVDFARRAARLDAARLQPVGDGACPACGAPPVASLLVDWPGAHGSRFCACWLCSTLWNVVRIKCTLCGSTQGIAYHAVAGVAEAVKAETCERCRGYVKILHQHVDPTLDPIADDVATLGLDLLLRETGFRRGAFNPFLVGY